MLRLVLVFLSPLLVSCAPGSFDSVYYWKATLGWTAADSARLTEARIDQVGLRLFDWGTRGEEGPLVVHQPLPPGLRVVPVVYVTTARLAAWAADPALDPRREAAELLDRMDGTLARAWAGHPDTWQLDADWAARTRQAWFAVAAAFRDLVHARGGRLEVTVRLHQYRDRATQGVPPADAGVLMVYGAGETVLDPALVEAYLKGPPYDLPLTLAFPSYTQVRQLNGYGRLVAVHRLGARGELPFPDLRPLGGGRYEVLRRSHLGGRPLLAHDTLAVDAASTSDLARVARLPAVVALLAAQGGRVWWFDYEPGAPLPRFPRGH